MDRQGTDQGIDPEGNRAAFDPSAAEQYEGAPAASAAPDDEDAPPEEPAEQIDYRGLWEAEQQRRVAHEQQVQQLQAERQQLMFAASQAAWQREEEEHHQRTASFDYEQKVAADRQFYAGREQRLMGWAQQATQAVWVNQFADDVLRRHGLSHEDRIRLGNDPQQMEANAQWIANERSRGSAEVSALRDELKTLKRQIAANQALGNPAYRQGGSRPNGTPPTDLPPGSEAKLAAILGQPWPPQQRR